MKNLFLVINKEKIYAYVVSILTIVTLFFMSSMMNSDSKETEDASSNIVENINSTINSTNNVNNQNVNLINVETNNTTT